MPLAISLFPAATWSVSCRRSFSWKEPGAGSFFGSLASKAVIRNSVCSRLAASRAAVQPATMGIVPKSLDSLAGLPAANDWVSSAASALVSIAPVR